VDELLVAAFEPVARDLRAAGLDYELAEDSTGHRGGFPRCDLIVSGVKLGHLHIDPEQELSAATRMLADFTQDLVLENVRSSGGRTIEWPPCLPSHTHPMSAGLLDGVAKWHCPLDPTIAVPIGSHP
jgi:hypothetical protein